MDDDLLGRRLRYERERRRITLESIAANSKISVALLRDLERDDLSRWPSGIFRRSFIRSYAEAIGLDADDILHEFLERYPDRQQIEAAAARAAKGERSKGHPNAMLRLTLADSPQPFSGGTLLKDIAARLKAAAWDSGVTLALALVAYMVLGTFWTPFAILTIAYYAGGILILGNSPGVCLFAPKVHDDPPPPPTSDQDDALDLPTIAATITR